MRVESFLNLVKIANDPKEYPDSLVRVYTDNCDVRGPFFGETAQMDAFDMAVKTGRPFKFILWAAKGDQY